MFGISKILRKCDIFLMKYNLINDFSIKKKKNIYYCSNGLIDFQTNSVNKTIERIIKEVVLEHITKVEQSYKKIINFIDDKDKYDSRHYIYYQTLQMLKLYSDELYNKTKK